MQIQKTSLAEGQEYSLIVRPNWLNPSPEMVLAQKRKFRAELRQRRSVQDIVCRAMRKEVTRSARQTADRAPSDVDQWRRHFFGVRAPAIKARIGAATKETRFYIGLGEGALLLARTSICIFANKVRLHAGLCRMIHASAPLAQSAVAVLSAGAAAANATGPAYANLKKGPSLNQDGVAI